MGSYLYHRARTTARTAVSLFLIVSALLLPGIASAQMAPAPAAAPTPAEIPENLTRDEVRDLVARLSDAQVRELIIRELDKNALAAEQATDTAAYFEQLNTGVAAAKNALARMFDSRQQLHELPSMIWSGISEDGAISGGYLLFQLIGLIVAGFAAEWIARRLLEKASKPKENLTLGRRFDLACFGAAMGLIELGAFAAGAFLFVGITAQHTEAAATLWHEVIWCLVLIKLVLLGVQQVAAPASAEKRLMSISDSAARQIWGWVLVLSSALILPRPIVDAAKAFGASEETLLALSVKTGLVFVLLLIVLIFRLRDYGRQLIAGDDDAGFIRQNLARVWWMLSIAYVLLIWFMSIGTRAATGESTLVPGLGSLALFVAIPYLDQGLKALITWYFEKPEDETETEGAATEAQAATPGTPAAPAQPVAAAEESAAEPAEATDFDSGYHATALRYARVLMVLALLGIFVRLWNINLEAITGQLVGERVASALFDIGITVLLAWALWGVIRISIERKLEDERGPEGESEEMEAGGLGGTRTETILPLIRAFIKITLIVMAVLISLSSLGVNIGPLIAGAGVVGLAIGFGAQTLVRDIVSGFFYLLDDAFRIGEYVVIDQIRGTVEKISIRSFQLRHHNGPVHTIPYGEIRSLTNWSRDWAIMKFELRIPFETDIDMVRKIIKKIGLEMMEDPNFGPLMLAPVKSQGVNRMDDSALIIRCKFTAVPGQQYLIRREAFTRIQRVFEEKGIQFAPRRVLVEATTPQEAVKAAAGVLDQEAQEGGEGQAPKSDEP